MTTAMLRAQTCSNCGDQLGTFGEEPAVVGRCCTNLPLPWGHSDETGQYDRHRGMATLGADHDEDGEEIERQVPSCEHCGYERFRLRFYEETRCAVGSVEPEPGDSRVYFDPGHTDRLDTEERDHELECGGCGREVEADWEWS